MENENKFGFVAFAETWNGRLAMLGFLIGVATEFLTGQGILSQIGLMQSDIDLKESTCKRRCDRTSAFY